MSQPLWKHQVEAIRIADAEPNIGLFFEQGTGKSRTVIEILRRHYFKEKRIKRTLILCPLIVCENWKAEFKKFSKIDERCVHILKGSGKLREQQLLYIFDKMPNSIVITNYESMQMPKLVQLMHHWHPEILICDESQRLKNPESKRAKAVVTLADITKNNYILTGTPILQSPMDLYMQFRILDRGATFGKNFYAFRSMYFEDKNAARRGSHSYVPDWRIKPSAYDHIQEKVKTVALRVLKKDCLDLPPLVKQEVYVDLSPEQDKAYKEMQKHFITFVRSMEGQPKAVVANLAVTKALRMQQIVTGFVRDEDGGVHPLPCPRLTVLEELLEDLTPNHKVIVWACFQENYRAIAQVCSKLGIGYRELHGQVNQRDRQDNLDAFRSDPAVRVLIANQGAGGVGINLVEASYAIYYSKSFRLEDDLQSEARNYRGGSEIHEKITRIDIVAKDTIDELVSKALANKQQISEQILSWNL